MQAGLSQFEYNPNPIPIPSKRNPKARIRFLENILLIFVYIFPGYLSIFLLFGGLSKINLYFNVVVVVAMAGWLTG